MVLLVTEHIVNSINYPVLLNFSEPVVVELFWKQKHTILLVSDRDYLSDTSHILSQDHGHLILHKRVVTHDIVEVCSAIALM